jgi:hypothetical protein
LAAAHGDSVTNQEQTAEISQSLASAKLEPFTLSMEPPTELRGVLPDHARTLPSGPLQLEHTGLTSHFQQLEFWQLQVLWKEAVALKLYEAGEQALAEPVSFCHTKQGFAQCEGCKAVRTFWNRCDLFYCPMCQPRLAAERKQSVEWWTKQIHQPKHVVLTQRNTGQITFQQVKQAKANLTKLRRSKFAKGWRGGTWSLEITNESRGWHLHFHLLVDANWIDQSQLAIRWGKLVGQSYAVVKVKDCRGAEYLQQIAKYVVKGSDLAKWSAAEVTQFVYALNGQRTFGVFGTLYGKRTQWAEWIKSLRTHGKECACGCTKWKIFTDLEWEWKEQFTQGPLLTRPPPVHVAQISFQI